MCEATLICVFLVFLHVFTVNTSCIVEEGRSYSLKCSGHGSPPVVGWYFSTPRKYMGFCSKNENSHCYGCTVFQDFAANYNMTTSCGSYVMTLNIVSVSRRDVLRGIVCQYSGKEIEPCDPFITYVKPEKPTCSIEKLQPGDRQLSVTCVTKKVFPQAECQLYNVTDQRNPLTADITYIHQNMSKENPVYFNSTCMFNIGISTLGEGRHQLLVKMFPNVINGSSFAVDTNVVTFTLSPPQVEVNSNCFNGTNVKGNFIKTGTISSCTCTMTNTGNPPGQIQWYRQGNSTPIGSLESSRSVTFTITRENTAAAQVYYCQVTSALIRSKQTDNFTREFAYGPDSVDLTGQNQLNQCPGEDKNISVVCHVPKGDVNPKADFRIFSKSEQDKINGNGTEQDEEGYFSYTYSFRPNRVGLYNLVCEAENAIFSGLNKTSSHNVDVRAPPKNAPVIKVISKGKEMKMSGSIIKIIEEEPVTVTCHVDGGYPPANVTLNCSSLNESSVAETVVSLTSVRFTREMDNPTCICTATHVSGCYQHYQASVWLNVSLAEPVSGENTGLDAAAVGGGIGAAVIVIVLVILVICVLKRKGCLITGFFTDRRQQNELILNQVSSEGKEEETITDNELYGTTRPRSEEIVTENDIYGSGSGSVPQNGARDYSSFTPSIVSAATAPQNLEAINSASDHREHSSPSSDVTIPLTQPKPAVSAKPKTAIKPKAKYNNVNVSGGGAGQGFVIQGDNGNQTYASVVKPAKAVSVCPEPKTTSNNDEANRDFYPDQSKKPDIPEKKFLKEGKDVENVKIQMEGKKDPAYEDVGLHSTSDSNTSNINDGFTGTEDETNVYSNTGTKGDDNDCKDKKDTGRYKNKDGLVYTQVDIGNQPGGQKRSRKPKIVEEGVNYTTLKFDEK